MMLHFNLQVGDVSHLRESQCWNFSDCIITQIPGAKGRVELVITLATPTTLQRPREQILLYSTTYTFQIPGHSHEFISLGTYVISWEVQSMVPVRVLHTHSFGHAQPSGYCAVPTLRNESKAAISSWHLRCNRAMETIN